MDQVRYGGGGTVVTSEFVRRGLLPGECAIVVFAFPPVRGFPAASGGHMGPPLHEANDHKWQRAVVEVIGYRRGMHSMQQAGAMNCAATGCARISADHPDMRFVTKLHD